MSPDIFRRAIGCTAQRAEAWAPAFDAALALYGADTRLRTAMVLAQVGHESLGLQFLSEIWGPSQVPEQRLYERDFSAPWPANPEQAKAPGFERNRKAYTLGNVNKGDGFFFRGHGPLQNTGRTNHALARDRLRVKLGSRVPDFEVEPDRLCAPEWGSYAAVEFCYRRGVLAAADIGDVVRASEIVNGGHRGLDDRKLRYSNCLKVLPL